MMAAQTTHRAYPLLNLIWGVISLVLLSIVLFFVWEKEKLYARAQLFQVANAISNHVDELIEPFTEAIRPISQSLQEANACNSEALAALEQLVFNQPALSGILIKNRQHRLICSTPSHQGIIEIPYKQPITLYGPVAFGEKSVFIIQKRSGNLLIHFYILEEVLAEHLHSNATVPQFIALYNPRERETPLQITRKNKHQPWALQHPPSSTQPNALVVFTKVITLDNVVVKLTANTQAIHTKAWTDMAIVTLVLLLVLFLIYGYLRTRLSNRLSIHYTLRTALKHKQFAPLYHPQIDTRNNTCKGVEVLLRWNSPEDDLITPDVFIQDAEQSELIIPITLQLMETAFQECQPLLQYDPQFQLAFNVSALHFSTPFFWEDFFKLCQQYHIQSNQLVLEITERELLPYHDELITQRMTTLQETGFTLAVDDFGTGHASLSYLKHFPFTELKIDKIFIDAIGTGAVTEALNQSIIDLARHLKLRVVAEGVETGQQIEFLKQQGVYLMQGWYFAKPMPLDQLIHFIKRNPHE